ncbi:MAG TPA: hypothetical protein VFP61_00885 [Acidimicrobiales bacterium]|nr:hypothetical protein [Acidimicrobiales bacterium]
MPPTTTSDPRAAAAGWRGGGAAVAAAVVVAVAAAAAAFDVVLTARDRAGTDAALAVAKLAPYVGIGRSYTLARAAGLAALCAAWLAVLTGLLLGGRWSRRLDAAHRSASLCALALAAAHATIPYASVDAPYGGWPTALVPGAQPFGWGTGPTVWESAGIVALYLGVVTGPSFYLLRARRRLWRALHRGTAAVYALAALHAFLLGSDFLVRGWPRVVLLAAQVPVLALLAVRARAAGGPRRRPAATVGAALAAVAALAVAALAVAVAVGTVAPGRPTAAGAVSGRRSPGAAPASSASPPGSAAAQPAG